VFTSEWQRNWFEGGPNATPRSSENQCKPIPRAVQIVGMSSARNPLAEPHIDVVHVYCTRVLILVRALVDCYFAPTVGSL
jgi:hypothetical protein